MKNQLANGVFKIGIISAEDVMVPLMLLLPIVEILLNIWTIDLMH